MSISLKTLQEKPHTLILNNQDQRQRRHSRQRARIKERIKSRAPISNPLLIFLICVCHNVACSCSCFCHAVTSRLIYQWITRMSDTDIIKIPSFTSFAINNIVISRGLAKEIINKRNVHQALYAISLNNRITLQAVGYISRCRLQEIEEASAI